MAEYFRQGGLEKTFGDVFTHTSLSPMTMADSDGLIKWGPHNILQRSQGFDLSPWSAASLTPTPNASLGPDGAVSMYRLETDVDGGYIVQNITTLADNAQYSLEISIKADTTGWLYVRFKDKANVDNLAWFDATTGTAGATPTGSWSGLTVTPEGNNIYRVKGSFDSSTGGTTPYIMLRPVTADNDTNSAAGEDIFVWGAHVYRSDLGGMVNNPDRGDSYVPTTSAAVYQPRRGHHVYDGSFWVNEGLLLETEERTNLLRYSGPLSGTGWSGLASGTAPTNTTGAAVGPDGVSGSASLLTHNTAVTGAGTYSLWRFNLSTTTTGTYTFSVWLKAGTITQTRIRLNDSGGNRAEIPVTLTSEWQRFDVTGTTVSPITTISVDIGTDGNATGNPTQAAGTLYVYGAQLEAGSTPSSYMPNYGLVAGAARTAESLRISGAKMPWDASNVSLQMQGKMTYADDDSIVSQIYWFKDANSYIRARNNTAGAQSGYQQFLQNDPAYTLAQVNTAADYYSPGILVPFNIASRHGSTFINGAVDGTALTANTTPTALPDLSASDFYLGYDYMGTISLLRVWNEDLGDSGIEEASS